MAISRIDYIKKSLGVRKTRVFWGQIANPDDGGKIEGKAKKDRALGKRIAEIQRVICQGLRFDPHSTRTLRAGQNLEFGIEPNPLNGSGVLQDLPVVVSRFFLGSRFGIFPAEFVINPDVISKQKSEEDSPYDDPERIIIT